MRIFKSLIGVAIVLIAGCDASPPAITDDPELNERL